MSSRQKYTASSISSWILLLQRWTVDHLEDVLWQRFLSQSKIEINMQRQMRQLHWYLLSFSVKNLAVSGKSWTSQKEAIPTATVNTPSIIKIHSHPCLPPIPSMFWIAAARSPPGKELDLGRYIRLFYHLPNAPATVADVKKSATRDPSSLRLYQLSWFLISTSFRPNR